LVVDADLVGSRAPWETGREGRPHQFGGPVLICRQKKTPSVTWTTAPADSGGWLDGGGTAAANAQPFFNASNRVVTDWTKL